MTPTDPKSPASKGSKRPGAGGGATYRHPGEDRGDGPTYHDGVHDHALEDELHNVEVAHEHSDVNIRAIVTSAVILTVVAIVSHLVIVFLFRALEKEAAAKQPAVGPVTRPATDMPPNTTAAPEFNRVPSISGPQLLTNEPLALERQHAAEDKKLRGYGWVNQGTGIAQIPIDDAKKLIVQRGLPVRAEGAAPEPLGTTWPARGESSGGRVITVPLPEPAPTSTAPAGAPPAKPHGGH